MQRPRESGPGPQWYFLLGELESPKDFAVHYPPNHILVLVPTRAFVEDAGIALVHCTPTTLETLNPAESSTEVLEFRLGQGGVWQIEQQSWQRLMNSQGFWRWMPFCHLSVPLSLEHSTAEIDLWGYCPVKIVGRAHKREETSNHSFLGLKSYD